ncbi:hypothetical protein [Streptomyces sp. NBC_00212]|uniref:hypothetical protein n=1 Tax=Streptomyces sp. NBC_00212 TaxID=2975684 RepID=UPI0032443E88
MIAFGGREDVRTVRGEPAVLAMRRAVFGKTTATARSAGGGWEATMLAARQHADDLHLHTDLTRQRILLVDDVLVLSAPNLARKASCSAAQLVAAVLLVGDSYFEPYVVLLALDDDPFGVPAGNDGPLLALDVLSERGRAMAR